MNLTYWKSYKKSKNISRFSKYEKKIVKIYGKFFFIFHFFFHDTKIFISNSFKFEYI